MFIRTQEAGSNLEPLQQAKKSMLLDAVLDNSLFLCNAANMLYYGTRSVKAEKAPFRI